MVSISEDRQQQLNPGMALKVPCKVASTVALVLNGEQTIDGVVCTSGDRVLVKNQVSQIDNGVYVVSTGSWSRASDFDGTYDATQGTLIIVNQGASLGRFYRLTTVTGPTTPIVFGTSAITFQLSTEIPISLDSFPQIVDSIATLKAVANPGGANPTYLVRGYYAAGDGGGGFFRWNQADATADNGGTIIAPNAGAGRWNRIIDQGSGYNVKWFGVKGDGATNDYAAAVLANTAAIAAGRALFWPQVAAKYIYKPTATMNLQADWYSDNQPQVNNTEIEVDTSLYGGPYFQMITGCELRNLFFRCKAGAKVGTGLLIQAVNPANFVSEAILKKVVIVGFNKNVDCGQTLLLHFEDVQLTGANEGFICDPAGFITTHVHINPYYASNARNVKYAPVGGGQRITFIGGAIELATGAAEQASFSTVSGLRIIELHTEGAAGIPALRLTCTASIDGLILNGTGGVTLGTNADVVFDRVLAVSASDLLLGGDGTQAVTMRNCEWRPAGNSVAFAKLSAHNTNLNGVFYGVGFGDPAGLDAGAAITGRSLNNALRGTLTPVIVGSTAAGVGTYTSQVGFWERIGNVVDFWLRVTWTAHTGTGNLQLSGLPYASDAGINDQILGPIMPDALTWVAGSLLNADLPANSKKMDFYSTASAGALTAVPIDAAATIWMSGRYRAA